MASRKNTPDGRDAVETLTFWIVGIVLAAVPLLVFFFSFGNVGLLGTGLGVEHWIAFLTGPAVDLSVAGCVIASSYLSAKGRTEKDLWPLHAAALVCGLVMIALNTGGALYANHWRLAAFDSVGPMLLIGWGSLAPWLWRRMTEARGARPDRPASTVQNAKRPTVQPPGDRPPAAPSTPPSTVQATVHPRPAATVQRERPPSTPSPVADRPVDGAATVQPSRKRWTQIGRTVYAEIAKPGHRPTEKAFQEALASAAAKLIATGQLPETYASPSLSTAKRVRTDVEEELTDEAATHRAPEAAGEAS